MMNNIFKKEKGFTLVETLVAIAILMLAILGPLDIASSGLRDSLFAKDQVTAYYLAQEGIEYVRYIRDYNYITYGSTGNWLNGLDGGNGSPNCITSTGCIVDPVSFVNSSSDNNPTDFIHALPSQTYNSNLYLDTQFDASLVGNYDHVVTGNASKFTRTIALTRINSNEIQASSTITWKSGIRSKTFTITENIFNLYQ